MKLRRLGVFVMIDALGFNFLREHEFLPELEFRVGLRTVLGYSCACQPTILTGRLPHEHRHGAMYQRAQGPTPLEAARRYAWLPSVISDNYRVRNRIYGKVSTQVDGYFSLYECPTRLLPAFDLVEHKCIFEPGSMRHGGNVFDLFGQLELNYRHYYWKTPEERNILAAEDDLRSGRVEMLFLYLPALDGLLHEHGSGGEPVHTHLRWYEDRIRRLREIAEDMADEVEFFVFSDHGMSDVHGAVDLIPDVESRFGANGRRYLAFYDSTMARFWSDDTVLLDELRDMLGRRPDASWRRRSPSWASPSRTARREICTSS